MFNISVPKSTGREIKRIAAEIGVSEAVFCSMALVAGMRSIERQHQPEKFLTPEVMTALLDRMAALGLEKAEALQPEAV
jgi:hypothetical protein